MFDPGGSTGRLRALPVVGNMARVALWGGYLFGAAGDDLQRFWRIDDLGVNL